MDFIKLIKNRDHFGKKVQLNFNKKGAHTTLIGGLVSLFLDLVLWTYIIILIKNLVFFEKDSNSSVTKIKEITDLQEVSLNETNYNPMFTLNDMRYFPGPKSNVKYDDELKRYITIQMTS